MYSYTIFGLNIHSEFSLSTLHTGNGHADLSIVSDRVTSPDMRQGLYGMQYHVTPESVYLQWKDIGKFYIREGCRIVVDPVEGVAEPTLQRFILGPVFGAALSQRGYLVLHASAIAYTGGVVAFVGESGWGKSTLAASLNARGYPLIADDQVVMRIHHNALLVYPGVPEVKLWPDSLAMLGEDASTLPAVLPGQEKRLHRAQGCMLDQPCTLKRLYIIADGEQHTVIPLSPVDAALKVACFTYGVTVFHSIGPQRHFLQCTTLANTVPVCLLQRRASLDQLPALLDLIENDRGNIAC